MDVRELVDAAKVRTGETSDRGLGARLGLSSGAVSHWRTGRNDPTFEQAMELAELAGLDPVTTAAEVRSQTTSGARYRRLLRRLAAGAGRAATIALALGAGLTSWSVWILPIMSRRLRSLRDATRRLRPVSWNSAHDHRAPAVLA